MISGLMAMISPDAPRFGLDGDSGARFLAPAVFLSVVATFWPLGTMSAHEFSFRPFPTSPPLPDQVFL